MALYRIWSRHGWVKWVALTDPVTDTTAMGRDWRSWEEAEAKAFENLVDELTGGIDGEASGPPDQA